MDGFYQDGWRRISPIWLIFREIMFAVVNAFYNVQYQLSHVREYKRE